MFREVLQKLIDYYAEVCSRRGGPVPPSTGVFLCCAAILCGRRGLIVDVGAGYGVSTLFLALGVSTGGLGRVLGIEVCREKLKLLRAKARELGLDVFIDVICGDAKYILKALIRPIALLFLDAKKEEYLDYLKCAEGKLLRGSLVLAHNVLWPRPYVFAEYLRYVMDFQRYLTTVLQLDPAGVSFTIKVT